MPRCGGGCRLQEGHSGACARPSLYERCEHNHDGLRCVLPKGHGVALHHAVDARCKRTGHDGARCVRPLGHEGLHRLEPDDEIAPEEPRCGASDGTGILCCRERGHAGLHGNINTTTSNWCGWRDGPDPDEDTGERTARKAGKLRMDLVDLDFVADMARQLQAGLVGSRVPHGWRKLDPDAWVPEYRAALLRHLRAAQAGGVAVDPETGASHWAGVAVNAMICWGLERIQAGVEPKGHGRF